jgi:hypothetical protein
MNWKLLRSKRLWPSRGTNRHFPRGTKENHDSRYNSRDSNQTLSQYKSAALPLESRPGLSNAAPLIYFLGALFYSVGFNVNQNFKDKIFLNNSMFQFFRSTPMNTVFPLLKSYFLLYPFYSPLIPPFPFSH